MVLLAPSPDALQGLINECEMYANDNAIRFNPIKTVCMTVLPKWLKHLYVPKFLLNGVELKSVKRQRYLGVYITDDFTDDADIERQRKSMYCIGNMIIRRFKFCSSDVKITLFKTYCSNLYGSQLWSSYLKSSCHKLKVAYNNICRFFMKLDRRDSISTFMVTNHVKTLPEIIRNYMFGFYTRLSVSDNLIVSTIFNSLFFMSGKLFQEWKDKLFSLGD